MDKYIQKHHHLHQHHNTYNNRWKYYCGNAISQALLRESDSVLLKQMVYTGLWLGLLHIRCQYTSSLKIQTVNFLGNMICCNYSTLPLQDESLIPYINDFIWLCSSKIWFMASQFILYHFHMSWDISLCLIFF